MRGLYFDCYAGISGDMIGGALIDLGVGVGQLQEQLSSLPISGYQVSTGKVTRGSLAATKLDVVVDTSDNTERNLEEILGIISASKVSPLVKTRSMAVFERLARAEASAHGKPVDKVHFHEVGAVDSIIDVVLAMIGFEILEIDMFICSPLRLGSGLVQTAHGRLPVPAPGTIEMLRGIPVYAGELAGEFVTPTGAAIVATLCRDFGALPPMLIERVGYGAGDMDPKGFSNSLRLIVGELTGREHGVQSTGEGGSSGPDRVVVIETNIDDMNPQVYGFVMERAISLGALDAFITPVQMKKDRPGVLFTILSSPELAAGLTEMLLAETTTLGVRYHEVSRSIVERVTEEVETGYGRVRVKVARKRGRTLHFQPEYDDCVRLARESQTPLIEVQAAAVAAFRRTEEPGG